MIDAWVLWLFLVGFAIGAAVIGVLLVRLPRKDDDLGEDERRSEAAWIAQTIERNGGIAPASLVEEVLDLHRSYLRAPRVSPPPGASAPPVPPPMAPPPPMPPQGYQTPPPPPRNG